METSILRGIVDQLPLLVFVVRQPDRRLAFINRTAADWFGVDVEQVEGVEVAEFESNLDCELPTASAAHGACRRRDGRALRTWLRNVWLGTVEHRLIVAVPTERPDDRPSQSGAFSPSTSFMGATFGGQPGELLDAFASLPEGPSAPPNTRPSELSGAFVQSLIDLMPDGLLVLSPDDVVVDANSAFAELVGYPIEDVIGQRPPFAFWAPGTLKPDDGRLKLIDAAGRSRLVTVFRHAAEDGGRTFIFRDITKESAMEQELLVVERQATIGTLTSGVAHEINNPLSYIKGNIEAVLELLRSDQPVDPATRIELVAMLGDVAHGAGIIGDIVSDLRRWTRRSSERDNEVVDLGRVLSSCFSMAEPEVRHRARTRMHLDENLLVRGNEARLAQIILNLIVNAAQSIPEGDASAHMIEAAAWRDGPEVVVTVSDTGVGMSAEVIDRLFEPFFTTKQDTTGTGLGLYIAASIIRSLGGQIRVQSEPGSGSTFEVRLPLADSGLHIVGPGHVPGRRLRVLVVDDDERVGRALQRRLGIHHEVDLELDPRRGLAAAPSYDVVICDILMPQMSGPRFVRALRESSPNLAERVMFLSGGGMPASTVLEVEALGQPMLFKPAKLDQLLETIDALASIPMH